MQTAGVLLFDIYRHRSTVQFYVIFFDTNPVSTPTRCIVLGY